MSSVSCYYPVASVGAMGADLRLGTARVIVLTIFFQSRSDKPRMTFIRAQQTFQKREFPALHVKQHLRNAPGDADEI